MRSFDQGNNSCNTKSTKATRLSNQPMGCLEGHLRKSAVSALGGVFYVLTLLCINSPYNLLSFITIGFFVVSSFYASIISIVCLISMNVYVQFDEQQEDEIEQ